MIALVKMQINHRGIYIGAEMGITGCLVSYYHLSYTEIKA